MIKPNGLLHPRLEDLLSRLSGVRKSGAGWEARCPAHDDHDPSLSINSGDNGRLLLKCHVGCATPNILASLGLTFADLAPLGKLSERDAKPRIVATYDYRDEVGVLQYQVVRYVPKTFKQRRPAPDKSGGWEWSLRGVRRVLYRLPELLAAVPIATVHIVEGEKDADRLAALGLVATCNAGGAGKWSDEYNAALRGRPVAILPDNDDAGRKHAQAVARSLNGVAASVKIVELPDLPDKGDVSNWLDAGGTVERLAELIDAVLEWTRSSNIDTARAAIRLADVEPQAVRWLWPGRIALGKLTLIVGDPGTGKSTLAIDLAARVSAGQPWPDLPDAPTAASDVLLLSVEDDLADTIRPRLDAAGGDPARVLAPEDVFSLEADLQKIERAIDQADNVMLLIVDPLSAYLGATDSHKNADVRRVLAPLAMMAARRGVAVVAIHHLNKTAGIPALYRAAGSLAFAAAARVVWLVASDPQERDRRLLLPIKSNLAELGNGMAYRIESDADRGVGRVAWESQPVDLAADDAISATAADDAERRDALDEAAAWLRELLEDGPMYVDDLQRLAKANAHSWATVRRAKKRLAVEARKQGNGRGAKWYWTMPAPDGQLRLFDEPPKNVPSADNPKLLKPET